MTIRERSVFFDVEAFRHVSGRALWCCGFRWTDSTGKSHVRVVDSESPDALDKLRTFVAWCLKHDRVLVGFNIRHYDLPFLTTLIRNGENVDAKQLSDELIQGPEFPNDFSTEHRERYRREQNRNRVTEWSAVIPERNTLDLASRYRASENEALRKGLKPVAALLGFDDIRELPYPANSRIDDDQWSKVKDYNEHDLRTTEFVFRHHESTFDALALLSQSCGVDLVGMSDADAAETYFVETYKQRTGSRPGYVDNLPGSVRLRITDRVPDLKTPDAADWQRFVLSTEFPFDVESKSLDTRSEIYQNAARKFVVGDLELSVGFGGIHSVHTKDQSEFYKSDDTVEVVNCDVRSYYPNLILTNGIPIGTTGSVGLDIYRHALEQRLELKRRSKDRSIPEPERRQAKTADTAFKVVANSLYGKLGYRWSRLNTPGSLQSVTITGQLGLIHLIEELQSVGVRVVQANTDGLVFVARKDDQRWKSVCSSWESRLGLTLEFESFAALALHDSNNWLSMRPDGSLYGKGSLRTESGGQHQRHFPSIVNVAVMNSLVYRIPPDATVRDCDDVRKFLFVEMNRGRFKLETSTGEVDLPKCVRGFAAYPSIDQRLRSEKDLPEGLPEHVGTAWKIPDQVPKTLNREWYVGQARRTLGSFGLQFDPQELTGNAATLWELGLVPQPAFAKVSGSGTTSTNAISCVDWSRYPTLKAFTGPKPGNVEGVTGIVAFDIDNPEKWQAFFGLDVAGIAELNPLTVHKSDTPEPVWNGTGRGKLLFRLSEPGHRFADRFLANTRSKWLKEYGFEIFYGNGTVSVFGDAGGGQSYRLSGELCDLPKWFETKIMSAIGRGSRSSKRKSGFGGLLDMFRPAEPVIDGTVSDLEPDWSVVLEMLANDCDSRFGNVSSYVSQRRNVKLPNGKRDNRFALRMKCPGGRESHESRNSTDREAELFLDNASGTPVFKCKHASCSFQSTFDEWYRMRPLLDTSEPNTDVVLPNLPNVVPTPISELILDTKGISLVEASTGSGKTYGACVAAGIEARRGRHVFFVTTSTNLVRQFRDLFVKINPDLADRVAMKRDELNRKLDTGDVATLEEFTGIEDTESDVDKEDKVLVRALCHESLNRRDFSRFARHVWSLIREYPDSLVIVDEFDAFVSPGLETKFPFGVRAVEVGNSRHQSWNLQVLSDCPASLVENARQFRSCEDCHYHAGTGRFMTSRFNTPTLLRPAFAWRKSQDEPVVPLGGHPIVLNLDDFEVGEPQVVHEHAEVRPVRSFRTPSGQVVEFTRDNRRRLFRNSYEGDHDDTNHENVDTVPLVFEHVFGHLLFPVVKTHHAVDADTGAKMTRDQVVEVPKIGRSKRVKFPVRTCESPYLVGIDSMPLEMLREFAERGGTVVFMTATVSQLTTSVISEVFGDGVKVHKVESPNEPIESVAVVSVFHSERYAKLTDISANSLSRFGANDNHDELGKWLILATTIRSADLVADRFTSSNLNYAVAVGSGQSFGQKRFTTGHLPIAGTVGSVRQPVGRGYDGVELAMVAVDVNATRLAVDMVVGHVPSDTDPERVYEEFAREELLTTVGQACGRGLRGEPGKRFFVVLLNCPPDAAREVVRRFGIDQRSRRVEFVTYPVVSDAIFRDGERWLSKMSDVWSKTPTTPDELGMTKHERRKMERTTAKLNTAESKRVSLLDAARDAADDGVELRDFVRKHHVDRLSKTTVPGVLEQVRKIFNVEDES